jgi:hypothetical protein
VTSLPPTLSLSDFETKFFYPLGHQRRAPNTMDFFLALFFLAIFAAPATSGHRAIAPRARGSMATAPGLNERRYCLLGSFDTGSMADLSEMS